MLKLINLTKRYRNGAGLGPITYSFIKGRVYAIVGPNGAGKSTLFNLLSGITTPSSGHIAIAEDSENDAYLARDVHSVQHRIPLHMLGFLSEQSLIARNFTPRQALAFDTAMRATSATADDIQRQLESFNCASFADTPMWALSQGMAKRADLALTFFSQPQFLILDEPLNALDTQTTIELRHHIQRARRNGQTLLLSSHVLSFVDELADEIIFLSNGTIATVAAPAEGKAESIYRRLYMGGSSA